MAWTAHIKDKQQLENKVRVTLEFKNDQDPSKNHSWPIVIGKQNIDSVKRKAKQYIDSLEANDGFVDTVPVGQLDLTVAPITNTPEQQAEMEFQDDVAKLVRMKNAVSLGLIQDTDTAFVNLKNKVKTALTNNPKYIKHLG